MQTASVYVTFFIPEVKASIELFIIHNNNMLFAADAAMPNKIKANKLN